MSQNSGPTSFAVGPLIDFARGLIVLRGETTKRKETRLVPISTQRLRAVLGWLRIHADGRACRRRSRPE